jgi:tetratricopeptide (TPR) repeat protein
MTIHPVLRSTVASLFIALSYAQKPATGPTPYPSPTPNPAPSANASVIAGKFALEDGSPPPDLVRVELICNSVARPQGWSDEKGRFSVQLGINNPDEIADLAYAKPIERAVTGPGATNAPPPIDAIPRNFDGCELRGALAGFRSTAVALSGHRRLDSPDVGTIVMHRLENVTGLTVSATTALAPPNARKAFEKAMVDVKKRDIENAAKNLKEAVAIYPRYAVAWFNLGKIYESQNRLKEANDAYDHSIAADDKYLYPYERLYMIVARQERWPEVKEVTEKVIRLDPVDFPRAYYFNAIANLNLGALDVAAKSAREAVRLDLAANPRSGYVLGVILARQSQFKEAYDLIQTYSKLAPAIESDMVQRQLAELQKLIAKN